MKPVKSNMIDIEIEGLTNSIRNAISGDTFDTEIYPLTIKQISEIKKEDWLFDWKREIRHPDRNVYKLVIFRNEKIIQERNEKLNEKINGTKKKKSSKRR